MPLSYWSYAVTTAVYLINRLPTPTLQFLSPYTKLFSSAPNYFKLRSFACLSYPWLRPYSPYKLAPRSSPCVFLGYSTTQSAYLCLDPSSSRLYKSRHVQFVKSIFPFKLLQSHLDRPSSNTLFHWCPSSLTDVAIVAPSLATAPLRQSAPVSADSFSLDSPLTLPLLSTPPSLQSHPNSSPPSHPSATPLPLSP